MVAWRVTTCPCWVHELAGFTKKTIVLTGNEKERDLGRRPWWWLDQHMSPPIWPMWWDPWTWLWFGPCPSLFGLHLAHSPICNTRLLFISIHWQLWDQQCRVGEVLLFYGCKGPRVGHQWYVLKISMSAPSQARPPCIESSFSTRPIFSPTMSTR